MTWVLVILAEIWRKRWTYGLPALVGAVVAAGYTQMVPPTFEARALLQVQSDQARAPMLRQLDAPGQEAALRQFLTNSQLLADTGRDIKRSLSGDSVTLSVLNNHLMAVGYRSTEREGLEQAVDGLAYNFIQALLAPERVRIEQLIIQSQQELKELDGRLATTDGKEAASRGELLARQSKLQTDIVQMQTDLRHVNLAFGSQGSQALIWFAEPASLVPPVAPWARLTANVLLGIGLGLLYGWLLHGRPRQKRRMLHHPDHAADASGMPLVGTLPWLGKLKIAPKGLYVLAGGKQLKPSEFSELGRLQRTLVRNLRGPLVLMGVNGGEGTSSLALLLAERTADLGKTVALVDMNLKDRMLSQWLGLGDGNWELPSKSSKKAWEALQPVPGHANLRVLAAPRHPETLSKLGEAGGLPVLFDLLSGMADVVIVDASPLGAVNRGNVDAVAVASASARTVLLAQAEVKTAPDLKRATDSLLLAGAPLLGVVMNLRYSLTRRQLIGQLADSLGKVVPPLGRRLRTTAANAKLD
jgi:Mrp family chromosome partitioning ATPase